MRNFANTRYRNDARVQAVWQVCEDGPGNVPVAYLLHAVRPGKVPQASEDDRAGVATHTEGSFAAGEKASSEA